EQAAAAAGSLEEQARRLKQAVSTFRVDEQADVVMPVTPTAAAPVRPAAPAAARKPLQAPPKPAAKPLAQAPARPKPAAKPLPAPQSKPGGKPAGDDDEWETF
ncbi:hypothetical protein PMI40_02360, partial [Herbaspirillum sp. YR522]